MSKPEIWIGARGWRHESWVGDFYPDDMPSDWWLRYYSNEFDTVLVPWNYLCDADTPTLQKWIDDTDDGFAFFAELPFTASNSQVENVLAALHPRLAGLLINTITAEHVITENVIPLPDWLETAKDYVPMAVDGAVLDAATSIARHQKRGCYWRPDVENCHECHGGLGIAEIDSGTIHDPKSLKKILEDCRSVQGPTTIGLFFGGDAPRIDEMRNAIMILQMLG